MSLLEKKEKSAGLTILDLRKSKKSMGCDICKRYYFGNNEWSDWTVTWTTVVVVNFKFFLKNFSMIAVKNKFLITPFLTTIRL